MFVNMDSPDIFASDVAEFFNSEFGNDLANLSKIGEVIERITKYEEELELEVNPQSLDSGNVTNFTQNAQVAITKIKELSQEFEDLQVKAAAEFDKIKQTKDNFASKIEELKEIQTIQCYLELILKIEKQSCKMEEALKSNHPYRVIEVFSEFKEFWQQLRTSKCRNFVAYVTKTMVYWYDVLKDKFGREFQKVLQNLHWPITAGNLSLTPNQSGDALVKFNQLFVTLCNISLPDAYVKTQDVVDNMDDSSILLPMQFMIQPLKKRFIFHFMGKMITNRLDKPEWYLTQLLSWIADNSLFVEKTVEPILMKENLPCISAHMQLMRGMVNLAIARLKTDLPKLLDDDRLLSHTIDEVLLFAQELFNQGYPTSFPNTMHILSTDPCFTRWRSIEHQGALEKMDKILSLDTAWKSRYQEESDIDDMHVPESAELFVILLLTMTERYSQILDKDRQLSFLELQLELLDDFRLRLHQLSQSELQETNQSNFCGIMNAIHYVTNVLEEWNNLPFFLQLFSYKKKKSACEALLKESDKHRSPIRRKESKPSVNNEEALEASVFDEAISLFEHMQKDLLHIVCDRIMLDIKAKSRPYRKEKWFFMSLSKDKKLMEVSLAAYPMLEVINTSLNSLQELLAEPLFTKTWQQIAIELDVFIFEEVVLQNSFNEGGASQFNFDMTRNLFPIFGVYTTRPENYFKLVKDSCILLNLSNAPAMLLKETLKHQGNENKGSALQELKVYKLSPSQALLILSQRNHSIL